MPDGFVNQACARFVLRGMLYKPAEYAQDVCCPVLLQFAENDTIAPQESGNETIKKLGDLAKVKRYPINHFDIYFGDNFEKSVGDQIAFFKKHL